MKVLYNWLREFVPLEISPQEAAALLGRLGHEIASVQPLGKELHGVVTAEVKDVQKHPNADRLSLCAVTDGEQIFSVVCGASNVRTGIRVPLAKVGAVLPNGEVIRAAKLRGVESQGMICSAEELGLEERSDGILILDEQAPVGKDIRAVLGLDDTLIELEVTPNRRDILSVIGVARELAAALSLSLKLPEPRPRELEIANALTVLNEAPELCSRYTARLFRDIRIAPSPPWMAQRLSRCGIRSINNVVDITNYLMLELGQPMHAFDFDKLEGRQIRVRAARAGETLRTLEGKNVTLGEGMLVIADAARPVALAGIIGGEASSISQYTRDIVLESASFQPGLVRKTSRTLGIMTESSYRFERGTDIEMIAFASRRAGQLVQELAGGIGYKPVTTQAYVPPSAPIKLRTDRIRQFLGLELKEGAAADLLRRLGCVISTGTAQLSVTVPSWRLDLRQEADLLEEIARLQGYDSIPMRLPSIPRTSVPDSTVWSFERHVADLLAGLGLSEACNYSLMSAEQAAPFPPGFGGTDGGSALALANPLSQEQAVLRTSLLPGLLQNAKLNFHRRRRGVKLFEIGRIFFQGAEDRQEQRRIAILLAGEIHAAHWRARPRVADFFEMKGLLGALLAVLRVPFLERQSVRWGPFHPKRAQALVSGSELVGWYGEIHPDLAEGLDLKEPVVAAELDTAALQKVVRNSTTYIPPSVFPPVLRDLSFIVPKAATYESVFDALRTAGGPTIESVSLIDLYEGDRIGKEKKSLTFSLVFRHPERTLSDSEVDKTIHKIVAELQKRCQAELRK